ncbi:hypothetical protein Dimus_029813 [Dionaea muscipula]
MDKLQFPVNDINQGYPTWNSSIFSMDMNPGELNATATDCFFNPSNWDTTIDQNDPFESALSSIVSSPTASYAGGGDSIVMSELIGRLGSIHNSSDNNNNIISSSTNTSCYSTPLNSPPKSSLRAGNLPIPGNHLSNHHPGLVPFNADPGFVERAAKYSCFRSSSFSGFNGQFGFGESKLESGISSRGSSTRSIDVPGLQMAAPPDSKSGSPDQKFSGISRPSSPGNADLGGSQEGSSVSEQNPAWKPQPEANANSKKRKSNPKGKGKEIPSPAPTKLEKVDESNAKRSKARADVKKEKESTKANEDQSGNPKASSAKKETVKPSPEPSKDYIHVRARRGQATDSHSLAERVRREKISERMTFLQDLVPGCSKVTGKAVVLDEIINYVQSLQRQVEFLSMKLAALHPTMDFNFNMETLLSKDILESLGALTQPLYTLDANSAQAMQYAFQAQAAQQMQQHLQNIVLLGTHGVQLPSADLLNTLQFPAAWENLHQNVVQAGIADQNQTQTTHAGQMKVEL